MKRNASKSRKMTGNSQNVARKRNISSVRDRKMSCYREELNWTLKMMGKLRSYQVRPEHR